MSLSPAMMAFFEESETHLETVESSLLDLEKEPGNQDLINELFRAVHSLKGNAGLVGLLDIHNVAIDMETLLDEIRARKSAVEQGEMDKLFSYHDKLQVLVEQARTGEKSEPEPEPEPAPEAQPDTPEEQESPAGVEEPEEEEKKEENPSKADAAPSPAPKKENPPKEKKKTREAGAVGISGKVKEDAATKSFLTFHLGNEEYGFDINLIKEIIPVRPITRVPNAKGYIMGIMNLRGMVIPVIDAKVRLNFPVKEQEEKGHNIIILEEEGETTGVVVDQVEDIVKLKDDMIVSSEQAMGGMDSQFITGVGKAENKTIMLIDINSFCSSGETF